MGKLLRIYEALGYSTLLALYLVFLWAMILAYPDGLVTLDFMRYHEYYFELALLVLVLPFPILIYWKHLMKTKKKMMGEE